MARTAKVKAINIPEETHKRISSLVNGTDMSISKITDLLLKHSIDYVEKEGLKLSMSKDDDGNMNLSII